VSHLVTTGRLYTTVPSVPPVSHRTSPGKTAPCEICFPQGVSKEHSALVTWFSKDNSIQHRALATSFPQGVSIQKCALCHLGPKGCLYTTVRFCTWFPQDVPIQHCAACRLVSSGRLYKTVRSVTLGSHRTSLNNTAILPVGSQRTAL